MAAPMTFGKNGILGRAITQDPHGWFGGILIALT
jgi:hypothetical protein